MRDQLSEALELFQQDGPYTLRSHYPAQNVVQDVLEELSFEGSFNMDDRDIFAKTVLQGEGAALVKVTAEDENGPIGEAVYVDVVDEEYQDPDEYRVMVSVVDNPVEWLTKHAAALVEQATRLMSEAESAAMQAALLQGKTIKYTERGDDDVVTVYVTDEEFLAHYREWYEGERTWGETNLPAEEYLAKVKAGEAEPVENHYYVKMTAEWLGGKDE